MKRPKYSKTERKIFEILKKQNDKVEIKNFVSKISKLKNLSENEVYNDFLLSIYYIEDKKKEDVEEPIQNNKPKIAFCLHGIVGGLTGKDGAGGDINPIYGWEKYNENIFKNNDVDIFLHTWSVKYKEQLDELYKPKLAIYEEPIDFKVDWKVRKALSRWYSNNSVLKLRKQYEKQTKTVYDFVFIGRYDLLWLTKLNFSKLEKDIWYISNSNSYPHIKGGYPMDNYAKNNNMDGKVYDLWFITSPRFIDSTLPIFDDIRRIKGGTPDIHKYLQHFLYVSHPNVNRVKKKIFYRGFDYELYRWSIGNYR